MRSVGLGAAAALLLALASGCGKSSPADSTAAKEPQRPAQGALLETVGRLHWLGKKRLSGDTNASYFLGLWNLPESAHLQDQTLDKLATAIAAGFSPTNSSIPTGQQSAPSAPNPAAVSPPPPLLSPSAALIRSLLADLVEEEFYLEVGSAKNQPGELFLAVHLNNERAHTWETNLTATLTPLLGARRGGRGRRRIGLAFFADQSGHRFYGVSNLRHKCPSRPTTVAPPEPRRRLDGSQPWRNGRGFVFEQCARPHSARRRSLCSPTSNFWLDASLDLPVDRPHSGFELASAHQLAGIQISLHGEGENVRTLGSLEFPALTSKPSAVDIPTNLIHDPLLSFCAVRGVGSFLKSCGWERKARGRHRSRPVLRLEPGRDANAGYLAAPWPDASNVLQSLGEHLQTIANPWLASKSMGHLSKATLFNGLAWEGAPFVTPQLSSVRDQNADYVLVGLVPLLRTNLPLPRESSSMRFPGTRIGCATLGKLRV